MELFVWLESTSLAAWIRESDSLLAYPLIITLHTLGLSMLVGGNVVIDLRLLGVAPSLPVRPLERLFRLMLIGFVINAVSGAGLFIADATVKAVQVVFWVKLTCITIGIVLIFQIRRHVFGDAQQVASGLISSRGKLLAIASLLIWVGAITAGRLMAYL